MDDDALRKALQLQAGACRYYDSPFYGDLLDAARAELDGGSPLERLVSDWRGDPLRGFLPLRFLGAVHERVLAGAAPDLAAFYPTAGGWPRMPDAWHAFREVLGAQREILRPALDRWPQTNEVARCAGLLGGFLTAAQQLERPLHLREIGASAGLNLLWDRFHYELGAHRWGDPASRVRLAAPWDGPPAPFAQEVEVASRAGCDLEPVRAGEPAELRRLESFVWADQPERVGHLRAAASLQRDEPVRLDRARAADWLAAELAALDDADAVVVFHSAVWGYLDGDERARIPALLEERGARAPTAWLRHEHLPKSFTVEVRLRLWPGGEDRLLGEGHTHGRRVHWLAPA